MEILVINEPFVKDFCRTQRWAARTRGRVLRAPDWLAYATAVLEREGEDVKLYDFPAEGWDKDKLRDLVQKKQPDVVVLDATTPSIYSDIDCARIVKEEADSKVIMVGPHVSAVPEGTLKDATGYVDVICRGEYDYTVRDVVKCFEGDKNLGDVLGISYVDKKGVINHNANRPLIENLDELPFPAWHHLDIMKYFDGQKLYPYIDMISGRGCPNRCIFCLWPQVMHGLTYRLRSPENVVDEMEYDVEHWPKVKKGEIFFEDDTFTVNKKRAMRICEEIFERGLEVMWSVNARVDTGDIELFKKMKEAGCRELLVGFESGDQGMLDRMNKHLTLQQSRDFVKIAHKAGLVVHGCFVLGLLGETKETMEKTVKFALDLNIDTIQFSAAMPFPGTEYYRICEEKGIIKANSWEDWLDEGEQSTVVEYPGLSKEEIEYYVDKGLKKFYFRPRYMVKYVLDTHSLYDLYRKLRGFKNFTSYLIER
jgi:anaerobic magnesium-protoporphyrin IX monomethyl ester cyclase